MGDAGAAAGGAAHPGGVDAALPQPGGGGGDGAAGARPGAGVGISPGGGAGAAPVGDDKSMLPNKDPYSGKDQEFFVLQG